jgi:hypothetical protein
MTAEEQRLKRRANAQTLEALGTITEGANGPGLPCVKTYSAYGTAWIIFPTITHARALNRWNEDGIAGISDRHQNICFAIALWNWSQIRF